jgi:hypothetical protein
MTVFKNTIYLSLLLLVVIFTSCKTPEPTANAGVSTQSTDINEQIYFEDYSLESYNITWDLGDGTIIQNETEFQHEYTERGKYTVTLTAYSDDGKLSDVLQFPIYIYNPNEKFVGTYQVTETWTSSNCGDEVEEYQLTVLLADDPNQFYFMNLGNRLDSVLGQVLDYNSFFLTSHDNVADNQGHMWDIRGGDSNCSQCFLMQTGVRMDYIREDFSTPQGSQGQCGVVNCAVRTN